MADIYSTTEEKLSHLYARVEKQPILTAEAVKNIFLKVTPAKEIETLLKQTEAVLSKKSEYVLTQQFFEVEKMLMSSASVVISGGAGEGKTYAAYEIMRRNGQDNNCIQIHSPNDVRFVDPRIFDYVFIDDIFGNHEVDESKLQSWVHVMEQLQQLVNAKAIHLIIATREIVLKECKRFFEKYSIFSNTCSLSSKKLSQEEKIEILASVLTNKNRFFSTEELQRCIMTFSSDLGFPYTCVLFASDDNFFREGSSFFKHNQFLNLRVLTKLNDSKKLSLLFLWIKDGISPVALKRGKENDEVLKKISRMVHYERAIDVLYEEVNDHCKLMNGVFVNEGLYGYQFTHNTVYQSIGHYFARIGHYELILEYSNLAFFMECISVTEDHYRSDQVFIRRELYQNLVDRIIIEVIDRKHYREMAMHSCLIKEILVLLNKALKKRRIMKEFFFTGCCFSASDIEYSSGGTFLSYYLETCAAESCLFLKMLQGQLKCNKRFHKKTCKICCLYLGAYHGACRGGNIEALHELKSVKSDSSMLIDAAYSGNISMYEYIFKDIGQSKCAEHEKRALHISLEQQNFEMYTVMRKLGCNPDSECLLIASKARNSKLLVDVLLEMNLANALEEDRNLKYVQSTVFSIEVLEALALVKLCPTKNDIVRSMTLDIESVESILWDLKYKVKEKERNVNEQIIQLWKDITEDQDLREKLEDIGLFDTYSLLARQVQKGHPEKVTQILEQLRRKEDLDLNNSFAHYLLNLSLKNDKKIFVLLLKLGLFPTYNILFQSVATEDIEIVQLTLEKMKADGNFDPSHKGSKDALLQSTLNCDIYNYLIGEGMRPKAYHFLYAVESKMNTDVTCKIINNLYSMVERCDCFHELDKNVMQLALLGAFEDTEVYTCLQKNPFQLNSNILPVVVSRGNVSQVDRLIANLKEQKNWPPLFDSMKLSLECSFYIPSIFVLLMKEIPVYETKDQNEVLTFRILLECRTCSFHKIESYILKMKQNNSWDPNDIVLKCSLLESSCNQAICELLKNYGVSADDILDTACETENFEMQSYIMAYLSKEGQNINFNQLNEGIIKSLSSFPLLCSGHLLKRAIEVSDQEIVLKIYAHLNDTDPHFKESEFGSSLLEMSAKRLDIYSCLFEKGFIPTVQCLLPLVKTGSYTLFYDTIKSLGHSNQLFFTDILARELVHESLKRHTTGFYKVLIENGIKPCFEDLIYAINTTDRSICYLIANSLESDLLKDCPEGTDVIITKMFPLYKLMQERGLKLRASVLLRLIHSYLLGQICLSDIKILVQDFFSSQRWTFKDDTLCEIYNLSKGNKDLFPLLDIYRKSEYELYLLKALQLRDRDAIENYLYQNSDDAKQVLPGVIRKTLISRKRLDKGCIQLIVEWIEHIDCDASLKILSSVLHSDTENTLQILYELSDAKKASLENGTLQTALEEAIYNKKTGLYCSLLKECRVKPTTYCLLYSLYHKNDACFKITLKKLPAFMKSCNDPYYKTSLALCCQRSDVDNFVTLLGECKICDTELIFEAVLCKNEYIFKLVKERLIKQDLWDFSLQEYWISSALIEADNSPSIKCQFETYYDDTINIYTRDYVQLDELEYYFVDTEDEKRKHPHVLSSEDEENSDDVRSEHDYEDLDSFILRETTYRSLKHIQRDDF